MRPTPSYATGTPTATSGAHEIEAHLRLAAARTVIDAMLSGHWAGSTEVLDELGHLVQAASINLRYARLSRTEAA